MDNKNKSKIISLVATALITVAGILAIYFTFNIFKPEKADESTVSKQPLEINIDLYEKVTTPAKLDSSPVNNPDTGRDNPFAPYK